VIFGEELLSSFHLPINHQDTRNRVLWP